MKTVLWCLAVFCSLLLAGAVVAPFVIDEEARKNAIAAELEEQLEARVEIAGEVSFSLLPHPQLRLGTVRIRPDGNSAASTSHMDIVRVDLDISPIALLSGESAFEKVHLRTPRLYLASPGENAINRSLDLADDWVKKLEGLRPLQLELSSGETHLLRPQEESRILADGITLSARVPKSGIPLRFEGQAHLWERTHNLSLAVGESGPERQRSFDLSWSSPEYGAAQGRLRGEITFSENTRRLTGRLTAETKDLEQLFRDNAEDRSPLPLSLEAELSSNFEELQINLEQLRLNGMDANGKAQVRFARIPAFDLRLDVPRLDLAPWLARLEGRAQGLLQAVLDQELDGRLRLNVDSTRFREELIQNLRLDATLAPGAALVERLEASAPGGSNLSLTGTLSPAAEALNFEGNLEAETGNLKDFLTWLNIETDHVPGERLRHASVTTAFQYNNELLQFTGLDMHLDVSRFTGGIAVALRERPGLGLGLEVDRLNLDGYLPRERGASSGKGNRLREELAAFGDLLNRFDANLDLRAERLTYLGERLSDLQIAGRLQGGELTFDKLQVGNLAGLKATLSGRVGNLAGIPRLSGMQFDLELSSPERLSDRLDLPFSDHFGRLGTLSASGILDGPFDDLSINSDVALGEASLFFSGRLSNGETSSKLSNGKIDLSGLTGQQLGNWLNLAEGNPVRQIPDLHATSDFSLEQRTWRYDTRLESDRARLHLEGTTDDIDIGYPATTFRFELDHPGNAAVLPRLLEQSDNLLPAIEARGRAEASPRAIELQESRISLDDQALDLEGEWVFSRRRPEMNLTLQGETLSLASLTPFLSSSAERNTGDKRPATPLPLGFMTGHQGSLELALQRLETAWQPLENLRLSAKLSDNRLEIEELSARVMEGRFSTEGSLLADSIGSYSLDLKGDLSDFSASELSAPLFGAIPLRGTLNLPFALSTEGASFARMLRNLEGSAELSGRLRVPTANRNADNPTGIDKTPADSLFALLDYPAEAAGSLRIDSGRLTSQDLHLRGATRRLNLRGLLADLPRQQMRATAELFEGDEDTPEAVMEITGPLGGAAFRWQRFGRSLSRSTSQNTQTPETFERPGPQ